jgi:hypothetical protein
MDRIEIENILLLMTGEVLALLRDEPPSARIQINELGTIATHYSRALVAGHAREDPKEQKP